MDMKRILQAMDGIATKPVEGGNDMAKFLSIVDKNASIQVLTEGKNPHKVTLPVQMAMQHYQQPQVTTPAPVQQRTRAISAYFTEVEQELAEESNKQKQLMKQYSQTIAERVLMREGTEVVTEKSKTEKQARFMAAAAHDPAFAAKTGIKQSVAKEFNKADTGTKKLSNAMKHKPKKTVKESEGSPEGVPHLTKELLQHIIQQVGTEGAHAIVKSLTWGDGAAKELLHLLVKDLKQDVSGMAENEMSGHSMGFTPGGGGDVGIMANEAPIAATDDPNDPMIHGHQQANPMTLKNRIQQARAQLQELADLANSDELVVWEKITRLSKGGMFMGLEQNLEQIRHGISELAAKRKMGGVNSRGIEKNIGEAVLAPIKPAKPKAIKPKHKTSTCRTGQTQTGMQTKDGKLVPKCSVK